MSKKEVIRLRCSDVFKQQMEKLAALQDKTVSEMIRDDYNIKIEKNKSKFKTK
jgi:hypothetical protein